MGQENLDTELTGYSLDDDDQLQPEDTLDGDLTADVLDTGYSPADRPHASVGFGTTAAEQRQGESIEQRIRQEEPDPSSAYGAPSPEIDDSEEAAEDDQVEGRDDDWDDVQDREVGSRRAGRLVAPDEGVHEDHDAEPWGRDVGIDGGAASAEEAAMHVIDEEDVR
ncbi:DUF5709 domain-containing protein [Janibacter sp. GXQ6167]|uniref:DUF5709 domain-containing protein n=1 Tax=Janibacter sp. GXQ6167 TaxID=3240791 RepID=UPI0035245F1D